MWIPKGTFKVTRHIVVDDVAVVGAGNWYSIVTGPATPRTDPAPDPECPSCEPSRTDSVGFYGKWAEEGGSDDVRLADFAIVGEIKERVDTDEVNGIGGALSDSVIERLYIQHTKVGIWLDGPGRDLLVRDNIIVDQMADGINIRKGWRDVRATNNFFRNTGDDAMAMWSNSPIDKDVGNVFDHNTIQTPVLANGIAIYGGQDNTVSDNLIADPVREGSALHAGYRHFSTDFTGHLTFARNTTVRAGIRELNWDIGLGAIWFYALEGHMDADFRVLDSDFLDVSFNAIQFVSEFAVKDQYGIEHVTVKDVRVDGAGTNVINARAFGSASLENVDARNVGHDFTNNCGSFNFPPTGPEFELTLVGGNDGGWYDWGTWCDDRPAPVEPPEPSRWSQP